MTRRILRPTLCILLGCVSAIGCARPACAQSAEITIDRKVIIPETLEKPNPQGMVDDNPPWIHVVVPISDAKESNQSRKAKTKQLKWQRRFFFKLSQDPEFRSGVIESGPKRWSFWNPLQVLDQGTWHWTYGVAPPATPDQPVWSDETYSFEITGSEHVLKEQPPSADAVLALLKQAEGPVIAMKGGSIGDVLPTERWPALAAEMKNMCDSALKHDRRLGGFQWGVPLDLLPERLHRNVERNFFAVKARGARWVQNERHTSALLRAYLITGDKEFLNRGIARAIELEKGRQNVVWRFYDEPGGAANARNNNLRLTHLVRDHGDGVSDVVWRYYTTDDELKASISDDLTLKYEVRMRDLAIYDSVASFFVDCFWEHIPEQHREMFLDVVREKVMDAVRDGLQAGWEQNGPKLHDMLEHKHYDQHDWQHKVKDLLNGTVMLARHDPRFDDWFKYAYDLWLYRSPAMSRDDGACREGLGYFGVHEHHLTHTGWMFYKLTGYNYYEAKPWFANYAKHMTYANPAGNPGQSFSDGGNDGADLEYFGELLAHICPDNSWNLWRFKTIGRRDVANFAKDMNKGEKAWDMLSVWREYDAPDVADVQAPKVLAAEFRDLGLAAMHTDLAAPANNLMVNFRSCPYGSSTHGHPAQNAFNVAFGGQPLFWRSGYYNGGPIHNIFSYKASSAHNTIMPDHNMQGFDMSAYGWLPRFATGDRISYCLGDASHAYNGVHHYREGVDALLKDVNYKHNGCNDVGLTRFRRHVALLRPSHVIVYDELEAKQPIPWTFRLHCHQEMKLLENTFALGQNDHAYATVELFCQQPMTSEISDLFYGTPIDDENKRGGENPKMWHLNMTTEQPARATRFFTVIEVLPNKQGFTGAKRLAAKDGKMTVGGYRVAVELDPNKPSFLSATSDDGGAALVTGQGARSIRLGDRFETAKLPGSTMLMERQSGKADTYLEVVDVLPDVLKYGNVY